MFRRLASMLFSLISLLTRSTILFPPPHSRTAGSSVLTKPLHTSPQLTSPHHQPTTNQKIRRIHTPASISYIKIVLFSLPLLLIPRPDQLLVATTTNQSFAHCQFNCDCFGCFLVHSFILSFIHSFLCLFAVFLVIHFVSFSSRVNTHFRLPNRHPFLLRSCSLSTPSPFRASSIANSLSHSACICAASVLLLCRFFSVHSFIHSLSLSFSRRFTPLPLKP